MTDPPRVVICGGGVAAVEALLALRQTLVIAPRINLIAPNPSFVYHPMAVAAPFGHFDLHTFDLKTLADELNAHVHPHSLARLDAEERQAELSNGVCLDYDVAIVAVGAKRVAWLDGALSFEGAQDASAFAAMLERLELGETSRVVFTAPSGTTWTLPLYELALLTASRLAERGTAGVELTMITPEPDPLAVFGVSAGQVVRGHLFDRGIRIENGVTVESFATGRLLLSTGEELPADEVVALPRLVGPGIAGLPADAEGFIEIDEHCRVRGLSRVYAAGDGTAFPVKQGGIATQQADVAAENVAADLGAARQRPVFAPMLRGMLLTGVAPLFLRASQDRGPSESDVAGNALWWPPTKIAGRHLGPYLAHLAMPGGSLLEDRAAAKGSLEDAEKAHAEARELALTFALADARGADYVSALSWLEVIERLDGVMPVDFRSKYEQWTALAGRAGAHA